MHLKKQSTHPAALVRQQQYDECTAHHPAINVESNGQTKRGDQLQLCDRSMR